MLNTDVPPVLGRKGFLHVGSVIVSKVPWANPGGQRPDHGMPGPTSNPSGTRTAYGSWLVCL
jgi:hypothetical protein